MVFGTSVFGYLNDHRMEIARKDKKKNDALLTDIAYNTGYSSLAHFSNAFKKKFGLSPAKMQKTHL